MTTETVAIQGDTTPYDSRPWLDQYPTDVPQSIEPGSQSIWDVLEDIAGKYPDSGAFVFQKYEMSFSRLLAHSNRMASALAKVGVKKGDVVLVLLPNTPHFPVTYYGSLKLGAALAAAPPTSVERELEYFIKDSGATTIVTIDLLFHKISSIWERNGVENVIVGKVTDFMPWWIKLAAPALKQIPKPKEAVPYGNHVISVIHFLRTAEGTTAAIADPSDVAVLQYTGGTTGTPKAATLTHQNLLTNARQMRSWFPTLDEGRETIMAVFPLFHVYGLTLVMNAALILAARTVLIAGGWVPSEVFDGIKRFRPTIFPGVPTLYVALLNDPRSREYDLSSIAVCVCGGAPLPIEVKREFEALTGGHLLEGYGLSEASPCTHAQPYDSPGKVGSIGLPLPGTEARIVDTETAEVLPVGEQGELMVRGPQIMQGYWKRLEETAEVLVDGWLHTGDVARMDEDGYFYIVDRKKDLIITGGQNIYPREIEEVLFEHPLIKEAAVAGVPHPFGGEIAKAFIVLKEGESLAKSEVKQFVSERLAKHKVPRAIDFREELPKSSTGKVLRRVLAEEEKKRQEAKRS